MAPRDLGSLGESKVEGWAHERGIIPNRPQKDWKGWDILLQFPHAESASTVSYPLDIRPPEISCMVQVKSTDKSEGKIKGIKLSNWERMAKHPLPYFFVILEFDGKNDPERAYLIHVGEYWIGKVLERLRNLEKDERNTLHERTMQVNYSDINKLDSPTGIALENAIRKYVGDDPQAYFKKKCEWSANVGFEKYRSRVHFTLPQMSYDQAMETLVDFAIGTANEIRLASLNIEEIRFGIPKPIGPENDPKNAKMVIDNVTPTGNAELAIIDTDDDTIVLKDSIDFYSPTSLFPFIPIEYCKVKLVSDLFSIIISFKDRKVDIKVNLFEGNNPISLSKLTKAAKFIRKCSSSPDLIYRMDFIRNDTSYDIGSFHSINFPSIDPPLNRTLFVIENSWFIINQFEIIDEIKVSFNELMKQIHLISFMKIFLNNETVNHASSNMEENNNLDLSSIAFLFCSPVIFGDTAMVVSGCIEGKGKIVQDGNEKLVVLENGQARCIKKWLTTKNTLKKGKFFEKAYEKSYQLLTDEGIKSIFTFERLSLSL